MTEVDHLPRLSPGAQRMRWYRERRRRGLTCIKVDLREVRLMLSSHADCCNPLSGRIVTPWRLRSIAISMKTLLQDADSDAQR